jgi:hypothetical protein
MTLTDTGTFPALSVEQRDSSFRPLEKVRAALERVRSQARRRSAEYASAAVATLFYMAFVGAALSLAL